MSKLVEMIVAFLFMIRSLMQQKSWEDTKLFVNSVPKS